MTEQFKGGGQEEQSQRKQYVVTGRLMDELVQGTELPEPTEMAPDRLMLRASDNIKRHVVQLEVMVLGLAVLILIISLQPLLSTLFPFDLTTYLPLVLVALTPALVRVTNPSSSLRSRLTFGLSGMGTGGLIGGGAAGVATGGLGAPAGSLIGGAVGFVVGFTLGPSIDGTRVQVLTQGEARDILVEARRKHPGLSLEAIIYATEYHVSKVACTIRMYKSDGIIKCSRRDLVAWLKDECWKSNDYPPSVTVPAA
ncbi:MAG: hypothetical protein HOP28_07425 [Gemmatimonadales bacterium]|nr:hypothetical protein [Gemmatimonadales bacterium]